MSRLTRVFAVALFALAAAGSLAGCASAGAELEGTSWTLTGWSMSSLEPSGYGITALFADGQVGGHGGVNSYGATYETGSGGSLKLDEITSTLMAGPEDANRAEQGYFGLLAQVRSYKLTDGTLTLFGEGENELLIYSATSE